MVEVIEHRFLGKDYVPIHRQEHVEVEEQAKLDPGQELAIQQQLLRMGGRHTANEIIEDTFYSPKDVSSYEELETRALHKQIIRIRKSSLQDETGTTTVTTSLTTKTKRSELAGWDEHVFEKNGDLVKEADQLLRDGDLAPYYSVKKTRSSWALSDTAISFDSIPGYGVLMEAERQVPSQDMGRARTGIRTLMAHLGVRENQKPAMSVMRELASASLPTG